MTKKLSTDPYKGVRDFYPEDMAVQRYMFSVWEKTAESFGFERYDASILEPSELYKAKGAENEEMVNEQTYTFTDRGGREVTLRPEMTPTVARMVAGKRRELSFPLRWYSIPNLFRYERTQRGRLREHWQLNCDIFGVDDISADVEIIALAHKIFMNFGADVSLFEIRLNNRVLMHEWFTKLGIESRHFTALTRTIDKKSKLSNIDFKNELQKITSEYENIFAVLNNPKGMYSEFEEATGLTNNNLGDIWSGLQTLGIENIRFDATLARGFDYYTGTVFEIFDTNSENNRSMMGGGRYDNLTELFGGEAIPGVGFGFGDVTLKNFLESHNLLPEYKPATDLYIYTLGKPYWNEAIRLADKIRNKDLNVSVNFEDGIGIKTNKLLKKIDKSKIPFFILIGSEEVTDSKYWLRDMHKGKNIGENKLSVEEIITYLADIKT